MSTIFTKIIDGDIPSHKVAETDEHIAFLDISPIAEGHTLVVPKQEIDYFFELPEELMQSTMAFSRTIAHAIDEALDLLRTGVIVQSLEVPHEHIHLIPLYEIHQPMSLSHNVEVSDDRMNELKTLISDRVSV